MALKLVEDVGAPVGVAAVDLILDATAPTYTQWANYGLTVLGYAGAWMGKGGDFVKNVGIASLPLAAKQAYAKFKSMGTTSRATARVGRYGNMGRAARMSAKPEFQDNILY